MNTLYISFFYIESLRYHIIILIPSITLYGSTPGYRNSCLTHINKIIESDSKVNPLKINHKDFSINNLNVNEIAKIADKLLLLK